MEGNKRLTLGDTSAAMSLRVALVLARFRAASAARMPRWGFPRHLPFLVGLSEQAYVDESSQVVDEATSSFAKKRGVNACAAASEVQVNPDKHVIRRFRGTWLRMVL